MTTPSAHKFVELPDGAQLHYQTHGSGVPLVFIHGGNLDHRMWNIQVGLFETEYQVITYDVRGFGRSSPKDHPHQAHRDLLALFKHLEITEPAHLVGLSLGGRIAVDFALTYPDRVRSLTLSGPGLSGWDWKHPDWEPLLLAMRTLPNPACERSASVEA